MLAFFNQFSHRIWAIDMAFFMSGCQLLKGGVLVAIIWWGWFKRNGRQSQTRAPIIIALLSCFMVMFLARVLASTLPLRPRPLIDDTLVSCDPMAWAKLKLHVGIHSQATMQSYFLAYVPVFFISKKAGCVAFAYTVLFIALPIIYLGLHYPSDIVVGAVIGITIALMGEFKQTTPKSHRILSGYKA
jgi:undecaprenyl-diphosphatase